MPGLRPCAGPSAGLLLSAEHQQGTGAAALHPLQGLTEVIAIHARPLGMQHSALGQSTKAFVERLHHQIGAGRRGGLGQGWIKAEMGAMGLIHQHRHAMAMGDGHQGWQITGQTLIRG